MVASTLKLLKEKSVSSQSPYGRRLSSLPSLTKHNAEEGEETSSIETGNPLICQEKEEVSSGKDVYNNNDSNESGGSGSDKRNCSNNSRDSKNCEVAKYSSSNGNFDCSSKIAMTIRATMAGATITVVAEWLETAVVVVMVATAQVASNPLTFMEIPLSTMPWP